MFEFQNKMLFLSFSVIALVTQTACNPSKLSVRKNERLTQKILNEWIARSASGSTPIAVDSEIKYRRQYIRFGLYDDADQVYQHLKTPDWDDLQFKLTLPDSLAERVRVEHFNRKQFDSSTVYLAFSPLLPLKEKNCYLIQQYSTSYIEEDIVKVIWTDRYFVKYRIRKNKIEILDDSMGFEGPYDVD